MVNNRNDNYQDKYFNKNAYDVNQSYANEPLDQDENQVIARSYPKTVYLWPTMVVGSIIWIFNAFGTLFHLFTNQNNLSINAMFATIWLIFVAFNLVVISFDFPAGRTFTFII